MPIRVVVRIADRDYFDRNLFGEPDMMPAELRRLLPYPEEFVVAYVVSLATKACFGVQALDNEVRYVVAPLTLICELTGLSIASATAAVEQLCTLRFLESHAQGFCLYGSAAAAERVAATEPLPRAPSYGPDWNTIAKAIRLRDGVCQHCGKTPKENGRVLDVHHIVKLRLGGSNDPENLIALCKPCHRKADSKNAGE